MRKFDLDQALRDLQARANVERDRDAALANNTMLRDEVEMLRTRCIALEDRVTTVTAELAKEYQTRCLVQREFDRVCQKLRDQQVHPMGFKHIRDRSEMAR